MATRKADRAAYIELCTETRGLALEQLNNELRSREKEVELISAETARLVGFLQSRPHGWLSRSCTLEQLRKRAGEEFDALLQCPLVSSVGHDAARCQLVVRAAGEGIAWRWEEPGAGGRRDRRSEGGRPLAEGGEDGTGQHDDRSGEDGRHNASANASHPVAFRLQLGEPGKPGKVREGPPEFRVPEEMKAPRTWQTAMLPATAALLSAGQLASVLALLLRVAEPGWSRTAPAECAPTARDAYVAYRARVLLRTEHDDGDYHRAEKRLSELSQAIETSTRQAAMLEAALEELEQRSRSPQEYGRDYDMLCRLPGVDTITVRKGVIKVRTHPVILRSNSNTDHEIGRFDVVIRPGQPVIMNNVDRKIGGVYDHPHVKRGRPCLGNMVVYLSQRVVRRDYVNALGHSIEFLHSYNPRSTFANVESWPLRGAAPSEQRAQDAPPEASTEE